MRDRPGSTPRLEWPGGIVPEWAKATNNPNRRRKHRGKGSGGHGPGGGGGKRERLQKVMAQSGHGSRRNIEILIAQGHITINGHVAKLGDLVGPGDKVKLDGEFIQLRFGEPLPQVLLYHKPEGEIVTRDDPQGRATVFEKLPRVQGGRWVSVGRLDLNTGGLLIFTTNGELANRLMHPRFEVEREYAVRLLGELTEEQILKLTTEGVDIEGEKCKFDSIEARGGEGANHWYHVVLKEGKNREVRKMCEAVGLTVSRLMRVRFGPVAMPTFLKRGMMREMEPAEIQALIDFAGIKPGEREQKPRAQPGNPQAAPTPGQPQGAPPNKQGRHGKHGKHRRPGGQGQPQGQGGQPGQKQPWQGAKPRGQGQGQPGNVRGKQRGRNAPPRGDEQPRWVEPRSRPPRGDEQPRYVEPRSVTRGDEQPRFIDPKPQVIRGDEQPRYVEPKEENQRGDEQPLTNENRRPF